MAQIGARVGRIHPRVAGRIDGREVVRPLAVLDVDDTFGGKQHPVAAVAGRHHAVHHVDTAVDGFQDVGRRADAHQVAGSVGRQDGADLLDHLVHHLMWLAHGQTSDGVPLRSDRSDLLGRDPAQVGVHRALHDGEQGLRITVTFGMFGQVRHAAVQPAVGHLHRGLGIGIFTRIRRTLVESHDDVGPDLAFDLHDTLRGEQVRRTVDVGLEADAFLADLSRGRERIHLVASAVGEDRPVPADKTVQAAGFFQNVRAGTQVQVIGIAQDDLGVDVLSQFPLMHALDAAYRSHRHEDGGRDVPVRRRQDAGAGLGSGCGVLYLEFHRLWFRFRGVFWQRAAAVGLLSSFLSPQKP